MRQGDGTDLLGVDDPRSASIGIIRVDPTDERKDVLTAILAQEELQRRQIAVVLHEQNKAFLHPIDFDGLKDMRRNGLKAEVVFVARGGSRPAEFARQRRFAVYSSLESFANALRDQAPEREIKRGWFGRKQKSAPLAADNGLEAAPATDVLDMRRPLPIVPSASVSPAEFAPARRDTGVDDEEEDIPTLGTFMNGATGVAAGAGAVWAGASEANLLEQDDEMLAPPPPLRPAANGAVTPSATSNSTAERPDLDGTDKTQSPPVIRAVEPAIITYPAQRSRSKSTGKLPAAPPDEDAAFAAAAPPRQGKNGNSGKLRAAMLGSAAAGAVAGAGAAAFASASTPAAPSGTPPGGANTGTPGGAGIPPRRRSRRWLALLLILLTILLLAGIAFATPGGQQIISHVIPTTTTATVTITPRSQPLANDFYITAVTGKPDPSAREVQARILSAKSQQASASANATGSIPGKRASGTLTFINTNLDSVTISGGTLIGKSGVPISFSGFTVPPGSATTLGVAVNPGTSGDIPYLDIAESCCASGILVRNFSAFTGGVNPQPNTVITQNDINRATNNLIGLIKPGVLKQLQGQVKANEEVAPNTLNCKANVTADHKVGDVAPKVTVTGTATCSEEVFDRVGALMQADTALRMQAAGEANLAGYVPVGNQIITTITRISSLDGHNSLLVQVHANGVWVYDFTSAIQLDLKHAIAGKPESDALSYVKAQPGVLDATIMLSSGSLLPMCSTNQCPEITLVFKAVAGPTGSPTLTPSSPTPTTSSGATATPTPQNGQGGS